MVGDDRDGGKPDRYRLLMFEVEGELHKGGSVVLTAGGAGLPGDSTPGGVIILQPANAHQRWVVTEVDVSTNQGPTQIPVPTAEVFVNGQLSRMNSRGATWSGNQDSFTGNVKVGPCDYLQIVFTGGILGSTASAVVEGNYYTRRG